MASLIQILLPLFDVEGNLLPQRLHWAVKTELIEKFGGLTAYTRAPAEGRWKDNETDFKDEIVIYEIMVAEVDPDWWHHYRSKLEAEFEQKEIIIRALPMTQL